MSTLFFIIQKEFIQIFRDKAILGMIFVAPMLQLLILVNAADFSIYNIRFHIVDQSHSPNSRALISKFEASPYFDLQAVSNNFNDGIGLLQEGKADAVLQISSDFDKKLSTQSKANVLLQVNGIDGQSAGLIANYTAEILQNFSKQLTLETKGVALEMPVHASIRYWYNPILNYVNFMLPGLLVVLVTIIGVFLTAMNIVKEKEVGTIEQLNVTPLKKHQFIIGKLFPFWCIGLLELAFGLLLGKLVYDIPINGNLVVLFSFASIYLIVVLSLGLFMSSITETQQQAMFLSFFIIIIFLLMSGLFTPIENMPIWAQKIAFFNPIAWFVSLNRAVLLKGSGFVEMWKYFAIISAFAVVMLSIATFSYRKRA